MAGARTDSEGEAPIDLAREPEFALGPLRFQPSTRQLLINGDAETLEPRVMQVVALLARRRGAVVSRDELVERCWEGRAVSEDAINRSIAKVRRLAETRGGFDLETIPRVGYRLVERGAAAAAPKRRRRWIAWATAALLLLGAVAGFAWFTLLRGAGEPEPVSLAVLPFRNLSAGDDFFAEGVAEEILSQLARQPGLRVAGRTSSWLFRDNADPRDVGRRLDVAYVLEGSVRRAGQQVRVDVALVGTGDGMRRWSQSFQGNVDDIFAIQGRIGSLVAGSLRQQIVLAAPLPATRSTRGDVYNLYLTARGMLRTREPANVAAAADILRRAVRLDPNFAPAWAVLADATMASAFDLARSPEQIRALQAEARRYAERAVRLAPDLPEAHGAFAFLGTPGPEARRHLEEAVRLAPADAELWSGLAAARGDAFDFEGQLEAYRRVAAIDPFWVLASEYPIAAWLMGDRDQAMAFEARMIRHHPEPVGRLTARIRVASYRRDWSEAYRQLREADRLRPLQVRARHYPDPIALLIRVGRFDEAEPLMSYPVVLDMARGSPPRMAELLRQVGSPAGFWQGNPARRFALLRLNQHGRGADILLLYDSVFSSPEAMATTFSRGRLAFLGNAGAVVVALRDAGRRQEAERMLGEMDRVAGELLTGGRLPFDVLELIAQLRALQGRRAEALDLLERAVAMGWQWDWFGVAPRLAEHPVYRSLRDEPRLRRIDAIIQSEVAREQRETAALGT